MSDSHDKEALEKGRKPNDSIIVCVLCEEAEEAEPFIYGLACRHKLHDKCLKLWKATACPICRRYGKIDLSEGEKRCLKCDSNRRRNAIRKIDCHHTYHLDCLTKYQGMLCAGCNGISRATGDEGIAESLIDRIERDLKRKKEKADVVNPSETENSNKKLKSFQAASITLEQFKTAAAGIFEVTNTLDKKEEKDDSVNKEEGNKKEEIDKRVENEKEKEDQSDNET